MGSLVRALDLKQSVLAHDPVKLVQDLLVHELLTQLLSQRDREVTTTRSQSVRRGLLHHAVINEHGNEVGSRTTELGNHHGFDALVFEDVVRAEQICLGTLVSQPRTPRRGEHGVAQLVVVQTTEGNDSLVCTNGRYEVTSKEQVRTD